MNSRKEAMELMELIQLVVSIIGGIIIVVLGINIISDFFFNKKVAVEVKELFKELDKSNTPRVIQQEDIKDLPNCIQKWLLSSRMVGKERVSSVRLIQTGQMRMRQKGTWVPFDAEQYFRTDEPGFIWKARIKPTPLINIMGRDKYIDGHGNMLIKLLALFPISDATGKEMDQGTLMRYLAEMMWFPTAALSDYITWEEIDENAAKATMSYKGETASAVFTFNEKGWVKDFVGERYMEKKGQYSLETWAGSVTEYQNMNEIRIPIKGEVTWKLKEGDFTWLKWEIVHIEYNHPEAF